MSHTEQEATVVTSTAPVADALAEGLARPEGASRTPDADSAAGTAVREIEAFVLGAGVCGIGAGIALKREGIEDFIIVDRAEAVGGTWHHNRYPGCACDIPSHVYSFSFAMNPDWSRTFAERGEIKAYLDRTAADFGLLPHLRLRTEMHDARWDEVRQRWSIDTTRGRFAARFLILAAGPLHEPVVPRLPGLQDFRGTMFHSANWPADLDLTGRKVAVIGTGASAIQFVPRIQPQAEQVTVFQRTPPWVMPKIDWRTSRLERWAMRRLPGLMRLMRFVQWAPLDGLILMTHHPRLARAAQRIAQWHLRRAIEDPQLRRDLTPDYVLSCKRAAISNDYYPALAQPNVEVVTAAAREVRERSIIGADGVEREVDAIIFGTGFHVLTSHPITARVHGRRGQTLAEYWQGSPRGYMGTTISGFPNAFMMFGPNIGTASGFVMAEAQLDYTMGALRAVRDAGVASIEIREEQQDAFTAEIDRALEGSTFLTGGCSSYYLDEHGRVALAWPWTMARMRRTLRSFDLSPYETGQTVPVGSRSP